MAEVISSHQQGLFTVPVDATTANAAEVLGNDNNIRTAYNAHDADGGVHVQSSLLAARPAAGTAGRKWLTTDGLRLYYDTGVAWSEIQYLPLAAGGTVAAATTFSSTLAVTGNFAVNTDKLTVAAASGNTVIAGTLGVGAITSTGLIQTTLTSAQMRLRYDGSNYLTVTVGSDGATSYGITGGTRTHTFNDAVTILGLVTLSGTNLYLANNYIIDWDSGAVTLTEAAGLLTLAGNDNPCLVFYPSSNPRASLRIPHGVAPSSPVDGDMWTTTAGLYVRINGSTVGPLT